MSLFVLLDICFILLSNITGEGVLYFSVTYLDAGRIMLCRDCGINWDKLKLNLDITKIPAEYK